MPAKSNVLMLELYSSGCDIGSLAGLRGETCHGCYYFAPGMENKRGHFDFSNENQRLLSDLIKDSNTGVVYLEGTEARLHKEIGKIAEFLAGLDVKTVLLTHALSLDPLNASGIDAKLEELLFGQKNISAVQVSLNLLPEYAGAMPETANIRMNTQDKTVSGLETILKKRSETGYDLRVGVCMVVTKQNIGIIHEMAKYLAERGIDYFKIQPYHISQEDPLFPILSLTPEDMPALKDQIQKMKSLTQVRNGQMNLPNDIYLNVISNPKLYSGEPLNSYCHVHSFLRCIHHDGEIIPCPGRVIDAEPELTTTLKTIGSPSYSGRQCNYLDNDCVTMWAMNDIGWITKA